MSEQNTFLTQHGLEKLQAELEELKTVKRRQIAERIQEAKELGDLSENAEYVEAKNEQAFIEGRILEIETLLKHATVIKDTKRKSGTVRIGSKITVRDEKKTHEYLIVGSNEADPSIGKISNESPIGHAFLGKKPGDTVLITVPSGTKKFEIVTIH